jgi:hypothetical protein
MNLVGTWLVDETDSRALVDLGSVVMKFQQDGRLIYTILTRKKNQIIKLRHQIDGGVIITTQPSAPRIERTAFALSTDGVLTLAFDGVPYRFKRQLDRRWGRHS